MLIDGWCLSKLVVVACGLGDLVACGLVGWWLVGWWLGGDLAGGGQRLGELLLLLTCCSRGGGEPLLIHKYIALYRILST